MSSLKRLVDDPRLLRFAPLVYEAWEDGDLTAPELEELRASLASAPLDDAARDALAAWLDPAHAPSAHDLHALRRATGARAPNVALLPQPELEGTYQQLERAVGLTRGARASLAVPQEDSSGASRPAPTFDVAALAELLDGRYADARKIVRRVLARLDRETGLGLEEQRARVRDGLSVLAREGLGARPIRLAPPHATARASASSSRSSRPSRPSISPSP
jgi:hypothetical protein